MWLLFFLFLLVTLVPFLLLPKKRRMIHPPPGPKGLPLIGNLAQFDSNNPHIYFTKLAKIYGPIVFLRLGCVPVVVIQSSNLAKQVLKTQDHNFCSRPKKVGPQKLSYNGVDLSFSPYNAYLREMRKIGMIHLFSSKRVQSFAPLRQDEILRMIHKISSLASTSKVVNLSNLVMTLTSSITCRIAFGKRYEDEGIERSRFHSVLNETQNILGAFFFSDYLPWLGWVDKLNGSFSKLDKVFNELDAFYDELIDEHFNEDRSKCDDNEDIIDVLLQLRKQRSFAFDFSLDNIKAVLMNILVGGTDTSAAMIIWAMAELMKNTSIMRKVQKELRSGIHNNKTFIQEDDLINLKYFKAVVKETFRLHPAIPLLVPHQSIKKCSIAGYDILPNTAIFVNAWAIGRDQESWNDPESFNPDRFSGSSIDFKGNDFELIPFGSGRRVCPGMILGVANLELALANLLYLFDWEMPVGMKKEDIDFEVMPGITMHKKTPLCLIAKELSMTSVEIA